MSLQYKTVDHIPPSSPTLSDYSSVLHSTESPSANINIKLLTKLVKLNFTMRQAKAKHGNRDWGKPHCSSCSLAYNGHNTFALIALTQRFQIKFAIRSINHHRRLEHILLFPLTRTAMLKQQLFELLPLSDASYERKAKSLKMVMLAWLFCGPGEG